MSETPPEAEASDADRLLAAGVAVTLGDGKSYRLRFGFAALRQIENDFPDGLEAASKMLQAKGWKGKRVTALSNLMVAALIHTGLEPHAIIDLLELKHIVTYLDAMNLAFVQAMPTGAPSPNGRRGGGSPGRSSTTRRRSRSGARTGSSGPRPWRNSMRCWM
jgi:hypothetical protein